MIVWHSEEEEEGKLIGLCLFDPDTLLNQGWQAQKKKDCDGLDDDNASKTWAGCIMEWKELDLFF